MEAVYYAPAAKNSLSCSSQKEITMIRPLVITAVAGLTLWASAASAAIVNLASVDTATGGAPSPTTLILGPGSYSASLIGTASGGAYNAWNAATSNSQYYPTGTPSPAAGRYSEEYEISIAGGSPTDVNGGPASKYETAASALAAYFATPYFFTIANPNTAVSLQIPDLLGHYSDNTGGISLNISAVPETGTWAMMIVGVGLVGGIMRRAYRTSEDEFTANVRGFATA